MPTISKWIDELYTGRRHGREKERNAAAKQAPMNASDVTVKEKASCRKPAAARLRLCEVHEHEDSCGSTSC